MSDNLPSDSCYRAGSRPPAGGSENWERDALERIALIAWGVFDFTGDRVAKAGKHTALIDLQGEISANSDASADNVDGALQSAFEDDNTVGLILRINSPGGSPVQAGIIYGEIRRLRAKYSKTLLYVVGGGGDMCASGGYYVAAADKIFVNKASIGGSIGVLMDGFGFTGLIDKLGVQRRMHTSSANKGAFDPFAPETPQMVAHAQDMLDQIHTQFIDAVKQGRGKRPKDDPQMFTGMFWTGEKSVELGLADDFGDAGYVAREIIKQPDIVDYTQKESISERVVKRFGASVGDAAMRALTLGGKLQLR
ncbi:Periplasmic serine proteases (ClpP class) [Candidatus Paraburkholderia kirkii UZHbot1]|uniref:Periplasmic serine proteases (ClpP class) n=1 Tax=Candidatus Paraburkholderia kirkii UZHbot1 TaxID=1055526 RepID=G4M5E8_9BURK|nr:Periplasmic serine proteases (ClpP class) [Candidatus Paraburkholderia kirkii UZHbot1]